MLQGNRAKKVYFNQIKFDSQEELNCYQELLKYYDSTEIITHKKFQLCDYPQPLYYCLDFETPDFYLEYKGSWAFRNSAVKQGLKTKLFWFQNLYRDKPFLLLVNMKKPPKIKGIQVVNKNKFTHFILTKKMTIYLNNSTGKICGHDCYELKAYDYDKCDSQITWEKFFVTKKEEQYYLCGYATEITNDKLGKDCIAVTPHWFYLLIHTGEYKAYNYQAKKETVRSQDNFEKWFVHLIEQTQYLKLNTWYSGCITVAKNDFAIAYLENPETNQVFFEKAIESTVTFWENKEVFEVREFELAEAKQFSKSGYSKGESTLEKLNSKEEFLLKQLNSVASKLSLPEFENLGDYCVSRTKFAEGTREVMNSMIDLSMQLMR